MMLSPEQGTDSSPEGNNHSARPSGQYAAAGVDIEAGNRAVELMQSAVRATYTPQVLADVGSFGGLFALTDLPPQCPFLPRCHKAVSQCRIEAAPRLDPVGDEPGHLAACYNPVAVPLRD